MSTRLSPIFDKSLTNCIKASQKKSIKGKGVENCLNVDLLVHSKFQGGDIPLADAEELCTQIEQLSLIFDEFLPCC